MNNNINAESRAGVKNRGSDSGINKIVAFFNNKWTRFGFSFISLGYLWFLAQLSWWTFGYYFVYENAVAVFFLYTFVNVMFAVAMIYTRRCIITKLVSLIIPPLLLVLLVYGFGNWGLILPPLLTVVVVLFASGVNETLKIVFGTVYMILFVLAFLGYIAVESLGIPIPAKMDLELRESPKVQYAYNTKKDGKPFRVVAYVDPATKKNRTAVFFIERTDLDVSLWNVKFERVFGGSKAAAVSYDNEYELKWVDANMVLIEGRLIEIAEDGKIITVDSRDETNNNNETSIIS